MCCDYGFRSGSGRLYEDHYGEVPNNVFKIVSVTGRTAAMLTPQRQPAARGWSLQRLCAGRMRDCVYPSFQVPYAFPDPITHAQSRAYEPLA